MNQVGSVVKALELLECFTDDRVDWTLKTLVERLNMPKTTVHRMLATLVDVEYLIVDPVRKTYHVGPKFLMLASCVAGQSNLRIVCRPELERLSADVNESVALSKLSGRYAYYLDFVEADRPLLTVTKSGPAVPAHLTSGGKILLSEQSEGFLEAYYALLPGMEVPTRHTIRTREALEKELEKIRKNGYSIDNEEIEDGLCCVAAPIRDFNSSVVATISISGPVARMTEKMELYRKKVIQSANRLSAMLGYSEC